MKTIILSSQFTVARIYLQILQAKKPDNFLFSDDQQAANKEDQNEDNDDLQSHGILDAKTKISIDLNLNPQG